MMIINLAWANHRAFGLYSMSAEDAIIYSVLGIVVGLLVAGITFLRR